MSNNIQDPFDFLFSTLENKKKLQRIPSKRIQGGTPLTNGIIEGVTHPRWSDIPVDLINDTVGDFTIADFWISGNKVNKNRFRIRLRELKGFLDDPDAFVDKIFDNYKRSKKSALVSSLQGTAVGLAVSVKTLKDEGLSTEDAIKAAIAATSSVPNKSDYNMFRAIRQSYAEVSIANTSRTSGIHVTDEEVVKLGRILSTASSNIDYDRQSNRVLISANDRTKLERKLRVEVDKLAHKYGWSDNDKQHFLNNTIDSFLLQTEKFAPSSVYKTSDITTSEVLNNHVKALDESLNARIKNSRQHQDFETAEKLAKVRSFIRNWHNLANGNPHSSAVIKNSIRMKKEVDKYLSYLRRSNLTGTSLYLNLLRVSDKIDAVNTEERARIIDPRYGDQVWGDGQDRIAKTKNVKKMIEAHYMLENMKEFSEYFEAIEDLNREIADLNTRRANGAITDSEFQSEIGRLNGQLKYFNSELNERSRRIDTGEDRRIRTALNGWRAHMIISRYTQVREIWEAYKSLIRDGGLANAIANGTAFFAFGFSPGFIGAHSIYTGNGKEDTHVFVVPKSAGKLSPVTDSLVTLYYLRPASIIKSLIWNGEGLVYILWRKQRNLSSKIRNDLDLKAAIRWFGNFENRFNLKNIPAGQDLFKQKLFDFIKKKHGNKQDKVLKELKGLVVNPNCLKNFSDCDLDFNKLISEKPILFVDVFLNVVKEHPELLNDKRFAALATIVARYEKGLKFLQNSFIAKWAHIMAEYGPNALKTKLQKWFMSKFGLTFNGENWISRSTRSLLSSFFKKNKVFQEAVVKFTSGEIALMQVIKSFAHAVVEALGFDVGGPLGVIIAWIVTTVVINVGEKVAKTTVKIGANVLRVSIIIFLLLILWISESPFLIPNATYQTVLPQHSEVYVYPHGEGGYLIPDDDIIGDPGEDLNPIYNGDCQEIFESVKREFSSSTVQKLKLELYPPGERPCFGKGDKSGCTISRWCDAYVEGKIRCTASDVVPVCANNPQYMGNLFRHEFTHKMCGYGGLHSYRVSEFCADVVGHNAGAYTFHTSYDPGHRYRATTIAQWLEDNKGITHDELIKMCFCDDEAKNKYLSTVSTILRDACYGGECKQ